jgi:type I restriction enzyme, S subunit
MQFDKDHWRRVKLADVAKIVGGSTPSTSRSDYWNGSIVWLSPTDLPPIGVISSISNSAKKITQEGLEGSSAVLLPKGTVVFSSRASIGKIGICEVELATNQGFVNFICGDELHPKFLAYTLLKMTPRLRT